MAAGHQPERRAGDGPSDAGSNANSGRPEDEERPCHRTDGRSRHEPCSEGRHPAVGRPQGDRPLHAQLVSTDKKAEKAGGLYLALKGVLVKPMDDIDTDKEYQLIALTDGGGGSSDVTPVQPE